jgi:hypothetical protein
MPGTEGLFLSRAVELADTGRFENVGALVGALRLHWPAALAHWLDKDIEDALDARCRRAFESLSD